MDVRKVITIAHPEQSSGELSELKHWTMKYKSHWHTYILGSLFVSHETTMIFLYQINFEI